MAVTQRLPVHILAGGNFIPRYDPARQQDAAGVPLILRHARQWAPFAVSLTAVANPGSGYDDLNLRTICDLTPASGPLGGLQAALIDAAARGHSTPLPADTQDWILLLAVNRFGYQTAWLEQLLRHRTDHARAVLFRGKHEAYAPYFALYHVGLLPKITEHLSRGVLALWRLIEAVPHKALPQPEDWMQMRRIEPTETVF